MIVLFFAAVGRANGVEFEIPMFSKKVVEQASDGFESDEECTDVRDESGRIRSTTCGAELESPPVRTQEVGVQISGTAEQQREDLEDRGIIRKKKQ